MDANSDIKKGDTQLFEQVPIVPESKQQDDFEDMIKKLKDIAELIVFKHSVFALPIYLCGDDSCEQDRKWLGLVWL